MESDRGFTSSCLTDCGGLYTGFDRCDLTSEITCVDGHFVVGFLSLNLGEDVEDNATAFGFEDLQEIVEFVTHDCPPMTKCR
ncbi:hypothetical protein C496_14336 [Natronorubrum tibetense GA33]|uniref:Uncharacterized protein n=1 Tax=Natronorubrum tibetense GA33 TaxID=1114856 RepID=L9VUB3_9EURY|nr:hypothetical protein C496_14336 [Natronorubrum tibetense GA33]